jgi:uronate dehydrogenase
LGYRPKDNAEQFAEKILDEAVPSDLNDPEHLFLGGPFASVPLGESGVATMNVVDDTKKND